MAFASLTAQLNMNISNFAAGLISAGLMTDRWANKYTGSIEEATKANKRHLLSLKDTTRIIQGILVSQAFYKIAQNINEAAKEVWEFNKALDYAQVTYSALFSSTQLATDFLSTLKDYSIDTIFSFDALANASKKLLAYGIPMENLMHVMRGVSDLTAMTGDTAAMDRISYAIGQIYAKGTLKAEEMRQLANAYVPIQNIIKEGFNLSDDDMSRVGDLRLPAEEVIDMIVKYAEDNFGAVADAAVMTITGLHNKIKDTFLVVGQEMLGPFTLWYKKALVYVSDFMLKVRQLFTEGGLGNVFEYLVPDPDDQLVIRTFLAHLTTTFKLVGTLVLTVGQYMQQFMFTAMQVLNVLLPAINLAASVLASLLYIVVNNEKAMRLLTASVLFAAVAFTIYKVALIKSTIMTVVASLVTKLAKAFIGLGVAIGNTTLRIATFALMAVGVILILASLFKGVSNLSTRISDAFAKIAGTSSNDILQVTDQFQQGATNAAQFDNSLSGLGDTVDNLTDSTDNLTDSTKNASKAAKNLLSFDEVFRLNEDTGSVDGSSTPDLSDLTDGLADLGDIGIGDIGDLFQLPDTSEWANSFVDNLFGDIFAAVQRVAGGAVTGGLLGALVGFALGAFATRTIPGAVAGASIGARIGAFIGGGFAALWPEIYAAMENSLGSIVSGAGIGAMAGALLGFIIGFLIAPKDMKVKTGLSFAQVGMGIGATIGTMFGAMMSNAIGAMEGSVESIAAGSGAGAIAGGLLGFILGMLITKNVRLALHYAALGSTLGSVIGGVIGNFFAVSIDSIEQALVNVAGGAGIGALYGALTGFVLGALATGTVPGGMIVARLGGKIGGVLGAGFGVFFTAASEEMQSAIDNAFAGTGIGTLVGGLIGLVIGGMITGSPAGAFAGAKIGAGIGGLLGGALGVFWSQASEETKKSIENAFVGAGIGALVGGLVGLVIGAILAGFPGAITGAKVGSLIGSLIGNAIGTIWEQISGSFDEGYNSIVDSGGNVIEGFFQGMLNVFSDIGSWIWDNIISPFITWFKSLFGIASPSTVMMELGGYVLDGLLQGILNFVPNLLAGISGLVDLVVNAFLPWFAQTSLDLYNWTVDTASKIGTWATDTWTSITTWASDTGASISNWVSETDQSMAAWVTDKKAEFKDWATTVGSDIATWSIAARNNISVFILNTRNDILSWVNTTRSNITSWVSSTIAAIGNWGSNVVSRIRTSTSSMISSIGNFVSNAGSRISSFCSSSLSTIGSWASNLASRVASAFSSAVSSIGSFISSASSRMSSFVSSASSYASSIASRSLYGHATGGIFTREHIARFAEGDKAEAVIPLENAQAMQPFVNLIANGVARGLAPQLAGASVGGGDSSLPPMYVGTLIADERGLRELERKMKVIRVQEERRGN